MEKTVKFRDYQEQVAADHNNIQVYARTSIDHIVDDVVTKARRYAGFAVVKTAQAEVQVALGRFYDAGGAVYNRDNTLTQSMVTYLAAASERIVAVSVYGSEQDTDIQERDFLVDTATGATEPDAVAMQNARTAVLTFTPGSESADPQPPAVPTTHAVIAYVLVDTTQVVSVAMQTQNAVSSTENLNQRTLVLEAFKASVEPRISSLASDIAALSNDVQQRSTQNDMSKIYEDIARVKEALAFPSEASDYGADHFLDEDDSDVDNSQSLGYDALVQEGIRFPDANADVFETDIFSANDPNASLNNGLLLPAFDHSLKMAIDTYHSDLGIAQYGFQTFGVVQRTMSRQRIRYGTIFTVCTNAQWWKSGNYNPVTRTFQKNGETFEVMNPADTAGAHSTIRLRQIFIDTYNEPYWDAVVTEHSITGAQVAQSLLISNDMWLTRLGFYLTAKAANEAVHVSLVELTNGVPDLEKAVLHQMVPHTSLVTNGWTRFNVQPTFLKAGKRYAIVLVSNANHRIGMTMGQRYLDGTFFYSTDGTYFQGDLTKDMMVELWGAKFRAAQVVINLEALNLDGGIRNIDILAGMVVPQSTELVFEVQPNGSGAWRALAPEDLGAFNGTPPLVFFRARFVGTQDVMPGLMLGGSQVKLSRPKTAFKHISEPITLLNSSDQIVVKLLLEDFDDTPHDCGCRLRTSGVWETADTTTTRLLDAAAGRYERIFTFNIAAPTTTFSIEITGTTNSAANTFHVSERIHWSIV